MRTVIPIRCATASAGHTHIIICSSALVQTHAKTEIVFFFLQWPSFKLILLINYSTYDKKIVRNGFARVCSIFLISQLINLISFWRKIASHKWWEAVFSSWVQLSPFFSYISMRKRAFAFTFFAKVIWGYKRNWAMHRGLFGITSIWSPTDIALIPWSCTLSCSIF